MKISLLFSLTLLSQFLFTQELMDYDLQPYNDEFKVKVIDEREVVQHDESLQALIIIFKHPTFMNAERSISNNPQLKEIKLFYSNQEFVNFISEAKMNELTHLFIERYTQSLLEIPQFPQIEHLTIQSNQLETLTMSNASLNMVDILDIDAPQLTEWTTEKSMPNLGLINLVAPFINYFPIQEMPKISQFSYDCSFSELPKNLCTYKDLMFISFNNYTPIQVDSCFTKLIKKGVYSNLTVYDKIDGQVVFQLLSKDREKENKENNDFDEDE